MPKFTQKYVSIPEAGRRLGRSPRTVRRLIERGKLSASRIEGCHARIPVDEVDCLLPARLRAGAADTVHVRLAVPLTPA